jgi:hypothetical protein
MLNRLFGSRNRWVAARFEKRLLNAAQRVSPVIVSISSQSENRYGIYVNGDRVWAGSRNIIAQGTARQIVERLKAEGFEVIPDFD